MISLQEELTAFYARCGFGEVVGKRPLMVPVYTGCMLVPMPNIDARHRYLKYHDLHHLVTGYSVGRIGEGEVSAWELGTGSAFTSLTLGAMNLIALSTGIVLEPKRMWRAFRRGCASRNLYPAGMRAGIDAGKWNNLADLQQALLAVKPSGGVLALRALEFSFYVSVSLLIHATIAIPALVMRLITDITLGYSFFQVVKPKKRVDLY